MKISIITCTWNSKPFLEQSIKSVLSQDYQNIEYIFVDGGSTDGTIERIASINRPVMLLRDVGGGIAHAMNEGVRVATGDVIAHLHSDDYYLDGHVLTDIANIFEKQQCGWLFGRIQSDIDGQLISPTWLMPPFSLSRLEQGNFIPHPATFIRRDLFIQTGGFDSSIKYAMDYDLWLRLSKISSPLFVNRFIAAFRRHTGSLSTANPLPVLEEDYRVRMHHCTGGILKRLEHAARYIYRKSKVKYAG